MSEETFAVEFYGDSLARLKAMQDQTQAVDFEAVIGAALNTYEALLELGPDVRVFHEDANGNVTVKRVFPRWCA